MYSQRPYKLDAQASGSFRCLALVHSLARFEVARFGSTRPEGPVICLAQAEGLGNRTTGIIGPTARSFANRKTNGRAVGPGRRPMLHGPRPSAWARQIPGPLGWLKTGWATSKRARRACILSIAFLFCSCFAPPIAEAQLLPKIPQIQPFGIDGFRLMLQQRGLRATPDRVGTALNEKPDDTVAVVMGDLTTVAQGGGLHNDGRGIQDQLTAFVQNGGALLVASDLRGQKIKNAAICNTWVREQERWLKTREIAQHAFHSFRDCPIVKSFDDEAEPQLFGAVTQLVSNRPSTIINGNKTAVAWLPLEDNPPLMCVKRFGKGKMLFVADHSLFVNEMLVHGDNARFVNNVTHWLCDSEKRERLVLIHDGEVLHDWTFGESPPSIPLSSLLRAARYGSLADLPLGDSLLPFLNESISRSQQENEFNNAARKAAHMLAGGRGERYGFLAITSLVLAWFFSWLIATRSRPRRWLSFQDWQQPHRTWSLRNAESD